MPKQYTVYWTNYWTNEYMIPLSFAAESMRYDPEQKAYEFKTDVGGFLIPKQQVLYVECGKHVGPAQALIEAGKRAAQKRGKNIAMTEIDIDELLSTLPPGEDDEWDVAFTEDDINEAKRNRLFGPTTTQKRELVMAALAIRDAIEEWGCVKALACDDDESTWRDSLPETIMAAYDKLDAALSPLYGDPL